MKRICPIHAEPVHFWEMKIQEDYKNYTICSKSNKYRICKIGYFPQNRKAGLVIPESYFILDGEMYLPDGQDERGNNNEHL